MEGNHFAFSRYDVFVPVLLEACHTVARRLHDQQTTLSRPTPAARCDSSSRSEDEAAAVGPTTTAMPFGRTAMA